MAYGSLNADVITSSTGQVFSPSSSVMKNRIINGAMVISQRNGTSSVTPSTGDYIVDRWIYVAAQASKFTAQQNAGSVTPPAGYTNYLGFTSSSAYSSGASDYFNTNQRIEGLNVADLAWGTSSAKTVTLSAWVYSSLTGTFGGAICSNGQSRSYPFTYTISSANTWTQISVTIPGDTTGTWLTNNGVGLMVFFNLGTGSSYSGPAGTWASANYVNATGAVSIVGTSGATFYFTGVQLEVGTVATQFEYRQYGTELALCQRYFYQIQGNASSLTVLGIGLSNSANAGYPYIKFPMTMRAVPTVTSSGVQVSDYTSFTLNASSVTTNAGSTNGLNLLCDTGSGQTAYRPIFGLLSTSASSYLALSSEL